MPNLTIRSLDDASMTRLRLRAAIHGRTMEDEARDILRSALSTEVPLPLSLGQVIQQRFEALGAADLLQAPREAIRAPADYHK